MQCIIYNNIQDDNITYYVMDYTSTYLMTAYSLREESLQLFTEQLRGCFPRFMKLCYT